jgi:hypothetical protein
MTPGLLSSGTGIFPQRWIQKLEMLTVFSKACHILIKSCQIYWERFHKLSLLLRVNDKNVSEKIDTAFKIPYDMINGNRAAHPPSSALHGRAKAPIQPILTTGKHTAAQPLLCPSLVLVVANDNKQTDHDSRYCPSGRRLAEHGLARAQ